MQESSFALVELLAQWCKHKVGARLATPEPCGKAIQEGLQTCDEPHAARRVSTTFQAGEFPYRTRASFSGSSSNREAKGPIYGIGAEPFIGRKRRKPHTIITAMKWELMEQKRRRDQAQAGQTVLSETPVPRALVRRHLPRPRKGGQNVAPRQHARNPRCSHATRMHVLFSSALMRTGHHCRQFDCCSSATRSGVCTGHGAEKTTDPSRRK